jgi:ABC-type multidrug transport system ATPase subunit/pSer/pThr/pTyr-binding forkhead associated (FHA) protein
MLTPGKWYTVGAAPDCDIVVEAPQVSGHHARLILHGHGYLIEDTGSTNGLWLQGYRVPSADVVDGDVIGLGKFLIPLAELVAKVTQRGQSVPVPIASSAPPPQRNVAVGGHPETAPGRTPPTDVVVRDVDVAAKPLTIGREPDCDLIVADSGVSGRHARVFRNAGRLILEDLGSRNGTFVRVGGQGEWVSYRSCALRRQDVVRVGKQGFRFKLASTDHRAGARVDVQSLELTVAHRATGAPMNLLNGVSFTALDGEVVGILGPSGSGKTSLLNVLAGFDAPTAGAVLIQGQPLHVAGDLAGGMGALVGHAPQFDVAHELLTVEEAVRYSARLRGSASWDGAEIERRVTQAIEHVGLAAKRSTPLGSETRKTLSGGQKKRVNIAMELVLDPPVLLLDEPTSGLSAHDTMELMSLLRRLADQGRTVILTIHQPSYAAFVQMDQVLLLEEGGHVAWFGPAALDSFDFFGITDREPGALLERMPKKPDPSVAGELALRYRSSEAFTKLVQGRAEQLAAQPPAPWPLPPMPGAAARAMTLVGRNLTMKLRDSFFLVLTFVVPAAVSALFVAVLGAQVQGDGRTTESANVGHQYLVVLTIMTCFFGALAASLEIVSEIPILRRERRGGLGLGTYLVSKAVTYAIPALLFPAVALATLHALSGGVLRGEFFAQWSVLAPTFFAAACAGLLLSSLLASAQGVVIVAVFYAIVQVVFSVFVPLHVTYEDPPRASWLQLASTPMTARWALAGLVSTTDLCEVEARAPGNVKEAIAAGQDVKTLVFLKDCQARMYQDHGVRNAGTSTERTADNLRSRGIAANLALSLVALLGAGIALIRRSKGTQ